jgi:hypothetical protein
VSGNLAVGFQHSEDSHFSPKPTVKIERLVWGKLCARVAAIAAIEFLAVDDL